VLPWRTDKPALIATSSLMPLDVYELIKEFTPLRLLLLLVKSTGRNTDTTATEFQILRSGFPRSAALPAFSGLASDNRRGAARRQG
jgi:hypothetical protein